MGLLDKFGEMTSSWMFILFRVIFGVLFALHGAQKLGWTGGTAQTGFMLFIGISELLIGIGIALGVLTRIAAAGGIIIMIGALATVHLPKGLMPLGNGEAAWLYLAAFLILLSMGGGKYAMEQLVLKKELI